MLWNYLKLSFIKGLTNILLLAIITSISLKHLSNIDIIFMISLWISICILIIVDALIARKMDIKYSDKLLKIRSYIESFSISFIFSAVYFVKNSNNTRLNFLIYNIVFSCLFAFVLFFLFFSLNKKIAISINRKKVLHQMSDRKLKEDKWNE
ncbi:hypothetical protein [Clostridiisalibacter paucivorans]|uniref:hypothetical protein n=1 Tax=Clostridiisalibacter paucivorans TaxID=408753 RepID=UPI00047AEB6A|nr:hypothetical protein [Clostridiisalibacter paucivorans]